MTTPEQIVGGFTSIELEGVGYGPHGERACSLATPMIRNPARIPIDVLNMIIVPFRLSLPEMWEMIRFVCPEFKELVLICKIIENRDSQSTETGVLVTLLDPVIEIVIPILISRYSSVFSEVAIHWDAPEELEPDYDEEYNGNRRYDRSLW